MAVEHVLAHLRGDHREVEGDQDAGTDPLADYREAAEVRKAIDNEQAGAAILRAEWMAEVAMDARDISASLRYNRPQSVAAEQEVVDVVRKMLEGERMCTGDTS